MGNVIDFKKDSAKDKGLTNTGRAEFLGEGLSLERICNEHYLLHVCEVSVNGRCQIIAFVDVGAIYEEQGDATEYVALFEKAQTLFCSGMWLCDILWPIGERAAWEVCKEEWESDLVRFFKEQYQTDIVAIESIRNEP